MTTPKVPAVLAPVDAEQIRRTYETALWEPVAPERRGETAGLLRGHIGLLLHEVEKQVPALAGDWRGAAEHVTAQARAALSVDGDRECGEDYVQDLATLCRALLILHEHAGAATP